MADFSAQTVLEQLGGKKFIAMTGARNFTKGKDFIQFKLPKAKKGISYVKITLTEMDVYTIEFLSKTGKVIEKAEDVYNDQLQNIFTKNTGLETHL